MRAQNTTGPEIETLIGYLAKLPGFGPRSARRVALFLLKKKESLLLPLANSMLRAAQHIRSCADCGNFDTVDPCSICADRGRDGGILCVVEDISDLWALERTGAFKGYYHVLGGTLCALDGIGPEDLSIRGLLNRAATGEVKEIILALNATIDGQTTAHYLADRLKDSAAKVTRLAHGLPVGGDLDYLDDGTLATALRARLAV